MKLSGIPINLKGASLLVAARYCATREISCVECCRTISRRRVSVVRYTLCVIYEVSTTCRIISQLDWHKNVLKNFAVKSPPYQVTDDNVSVRLECLKITQISGLERCSVAVVFSRYFTKRTAKAETPTQHQQPNRLYREMCTSAASREFHRDRGEHVIAPGHELIARM